MGLPKLFDIRLRTPLNKALTAHAPGSSIFSRVLKVTIDVAHVAMAGLTTIVALSIVASLFIPISNLSITIDSGTEARQMPLSRGLLVFVLCVIGAYFTGFFLILRQLRQIFATLLIGDPFQPGNAGRLNLIALILAAVTYGGWLAQGLAARHLAPGALEAPGISQLLTPSFAIIIIFVLSEVFREGSRLRKESALTI